MTKSTTKITYAILAAALGLAMSSSYITAALAASPHFIQASCGPVAADGTLTCSFKEAGLGDNQNISYVLSGSATAVYACINGGGNHPQASNKETVSGPVSATGTFSSGKNGQITASLTLSPPDKGSFSCPNGQKLVLASVSYTGITITDTTNHVSTSVSCNGCSRTFFNIQGTTIAVPFAPSFFLGPHEDQLARFFQEKKYFYAAEALGFSDFTVCHPRVATLHYPTTKSSTGLTCSFKAAGLGNVATNVFLTASSVSGLYQCVNPGGNSPPPKQFTFTNLQGPTVTVTPRNGQITASPTLPAPPNPTATQLGCPNPHWTVALIGPLTYTNVVLHIQQGSTDILTFNFGTIDP